MALRHPLLDPNYRLRSVSTHSKDHPVLLLHTAARYNSTDTHHCHMEAFFAHTEEAGLLLNVATCYSLLTTCYLLFHMQAFFAHAEEAGFSVSLLARQDRVIVCEMRLNQQVAYRSTDAPSN